MDVKRSTDGRDRLLVEISADRWQRTRVIAVTAGCDAAHIDDGEARLRRLKADRRKLLGIFFEIRNVQLVEPTGSENLHADRNVLQILFALGGGDNDDVALFFG